MKYVLLVEDDPRKASTIKRWCKKAGVEVIHVNTVADASRRLWMRSAEIGAVITDWQFPFSPGESPRDHAGEIVVKQAKERGMPFLIISGRSAPIEGYEPWINANDVQELLRWLQSAKAQCPALVG